MAKFVVISTHGLSGHNRDLLSVEVDAADPTAAVVQVCGVDEDSLKCETFGSSFRTWFVLSDSPDPDVAVVVVQVS